MLILLTFVTGVIVSVLFSQAANEVRNRANLRYWALVQAAMHSLFTLNYKLCWHDTIAMAYLYSIYWFYLVDGFLALDRGFERRGMLVGIT